MKKITYIGLLLCLVPAMHAEVVVLQSGQTMEGEIVLQNKDIVLLRDKEGHKFQFPCAEVVEIKSNELTTENIEQTVTSNNGNCALRLDMSGGALFVPSLSNGGSGGLDIQIGTRQIGQQRVFLGGSVGYQAAVTNQVYHFLPLMAVFSMPLTSGRHAPEIGTAIGYGVAIKNPTKGGIITKIDLSWRYQFASTSALLFGVQARWQQAQVRLEENITERDEDGTVTYNQNFTSTLGRNFVNIGLRLALEF